MCSPYAAALCAGERRRLSGSGIGLIVLEMSLHAGDDLAGQGLYIPLGHPAVRAGYIPVRSRELYDAGDLGGKAGMAPVSDKGIAQVCIFSMGVLKHAYP